jgi:hypothetical protein
MKEFSSTRSRMLHQEEQRLISIAWWSRSQLRSAEFVIFFLCVTSSSEDSSTRMYRRSEFFIGA